MVMMGGGLERTTENALVFNGIDAASGQYLLPAMTAEEVSNIARGISQEPDHLKELRWWHHRVSEASFGPREGVDPTKLEQTGWAVVFAHGSDPAVKAALAPLLQHRRAQAAAKSEGLYRELQYRPGESKQQFLARHGAGPGAADPDKVPYYLLLVGGPEDVPYSFQYQLDVQYAVGRLHFDAVEDYAHYARSVVSAEAADFILPRRALFFATRNPDDRATELSADELVGPISEHMQGQAHGWDVAALVGADASKDRLTEILGGSGSAAILFTASHGVGFRAGHELQLRHQGALLCQDWPGPLRWSKPINPNQYLSADDIHDEGSPHGMICFHFACFGAGTPQWDDFAHAQGQARRELAPRPFVAGLPKRLLGHPNGGALAVVGHVDRAWGYSFFWPDVGRQTQVYESCLMRLLGGHPIGSAFEYVNERYAELASDLSVALEDIEFGKVPDHLELSGMWTAHNDARGFAILGDPAVCPLGPHGRAASTAQRRGAAAAASGLTDATTATSNGPPPAIRPPPDVETPSPITPVAPPGPDAPPHTTPTTGRDTVTGEDSVVVDYALLDAARRMRDRLHDSLESAVESLGDALHRTVERVTLIEVATYVSDDPTGAEYDRETGTFGQGVKLRALTRLNLTGDAVLLVPEHADVLDDRLWSMHMAMLEQARVTQHELLKSLAAAAAGLFDAVKGL